MMCSYIISLLFLVLSPIYPLLYLWSSPFFHPSLPSAIHSSLFYPLPTPSHLLYSSLPPTSTAAPESTNTTTDPPSSGGVNTAVIVGTLIACAIAVTLGTVVTALVWFHSHHVNPNITHITEQGTPLEEVVTTSTCGESSTPGCITHISTFNITSEKANHFDEANDFGLDIQKGAIADGVNLTIDIGVALFGPFQFPTGLRPVSPVLWVHRERKDIQLSKPVTLTIPHFLGLANDEDIESLGLTFLKSDNKKNAKGQYELHPINDESIEFKPKRGFGALKTTHFSCFVCIASKDNATCLRKARFCITRIFPKCAIVNAKQDAFFFISLYLKTCLNRIDDFIAHKNLSDYVTKSTEFQFNKQSKAQPTLEMIITQPRHGTHVKAIGVDGKTKVLKILNHFHNQLLRIFLY